MVPTTTDILSAIGEINTMAVDSGQECSLTALVSKWALAREQDYRQLGSQISMFHVDCEIGRPVRIGYIHAKFVMTSAI